MVRLLALTVAIIRHAEDGDRMKNAPALPAINRSCFALGRSRLAPLVLCKKSPRPNGRHQTEDARLFRDGKISSLGFLRPLSNLRPQLGSSTCCKRFSSRTLIITCRLGERVIQCAGLRVHLQLDFSVKMCEPGNISIKWLGGETL